MVTTRELLNELCNEKRFFKGVGSALREVRNAVGDGLFTVSFKFLALLLFNIQKDNRPFLMKKIGQSHVH